MSRHQFQLYIAGNLPISERAIANLHLICKKYLAGEWEIEVIDVLEQPRLAKQAAISSTPTLLRIFPPPVRQVIGDFLDIEKIVVELGLCLDTPTIRITENASDNGTELT